MKTYRNASISLAWTAAIFLGLSQPPHAAGQNPQPLPGANAPLIQAQPIIRPDYVLGPNDQILIRVPQAEEINERPFRIDSEGLVTLPIIGRVRAAGLTVQALEAEIVTRLREFILAPQVSISLVHAKAAYHPPRPLPMTSPSARCRSRWSPMNSRPQISPGRSSALEQRSPDIKIA